MKPTLFFNSLFIFFCSLFLAEELNAQSVPVPTALKFERWEAGTVLDDSEVQAYGIDKCFKAEVIKGDILNRMWNKSYKEGCPVDHVRLRYLKVLHRNADGKTQLGELVCNVTIVDKLLRIFRSLYDAGYKIERMVLVDEYGADDDLSMKANNTSCFNFRPVPGTKHLSKHAYGLAIDINTLYNPYVRSRNGKTEVLPSTGRKYAFNRATRKDIPYKIDRSDLAYKLFTAEGFTWGGSWRTMKDYQHFEYNH